MKNSLGIIFLAAFFTTGFCASSAFAQTHSISLGQASTSTTLSTSTSTESLILDLQSLSAALDDIQKQIQKLVR